MENLSTILIALLILAFLQLIILVYYLAGVRNQINQYWKKLRRQFSLRADKAELAFELSKQDISDSDLKLIRDSRLAAISSRDLSSQKFTNEISFSKFVYQFTSKFSSTNSIKLKAQLADLKNSETPLNLAITNYSSLIKPYNRFTNFPLLKPLLSLLSFKPFPEFPRPASKN